jgi:hypothetical protein
MQVAGFHPSQEIGDSILNVTTVNTLRIMPDVRKRIFTVIEVSII